MVYKPDIPYVDITLWALLFLSPLAFFSYRHKAIMAKERYFAWRIGRDVTNWQWP